MRALWLLLPLLACSSGEDTDSEGQVWTPDTVRSYIDNAAQDYPGRAVAWRAVGSDGNFWEGAIGSRDGVAGDDATVLDKFDIGSATKMFTAVSILQLVEQEELHLDDPIANFVDVQLLDQLVAGHGAKLHVRHLLNHRSGMGDHINLADDATVLGIYGTEGDRVYTPRDLIDITISYSDPQVVGGRPDVPFPVFTLDSEGVNSFDEITITSYSNTGYVLLGLVVESVSGKDWEDYVQDHILDPLGMNNTGFGTRGAVSDWVGHASGITDGPVRMSPSLAWSAGTVVSTVHDMTVFLNAAVEGDVFEHVGTGRDFREDDVLSLGGIYPYGFGQMQIVPDCFGHLGQTFGAEFVGCHAHQANTTVVAAFGDSQAIDMSELAKRLSASVR